MRNKFNNRENNLINIQGYARAYTHSHSGNAVKQGDKPVLNLSAKINVHAGEIQAQHPESEKRRTTAVPLCCCVCYSSKKVENNNL